MSESAFTTDSEKFVMASNGVEVTLDFFDGTVGVLGLASDSEVWLDFEFLEYAYSKLQEMKEQRGIPTG